MCCAEPLPSARRQEREDRFPRSEEDHGWEISRSVAEAPSHICCLITIEHVCACAYT